MHDHLLILTHITLHSGSFFVLKKLQVGNCAATDSLSVPRMCAHVHSVWCVHRLEALIKNRDGVMISTLAG